MSFTDRIRTIYRKELTDILRDRRTLVAMIVVPIVLYPLLMLGSIQAVSYQAEALEDERIAIGVVGKNEALFLQKIIKEDAEILAAADPPTDSDADQEEESIKPIDDADIRILESVEQMDRLIHGRLIHLGVILDADHMLEDIDRQISVDYHVDREDVRSATAMFRVDAVIQRTNDRLCAHRLAVRNLPVEMIEPFVATVTDLAVPSSILGQILPLILILMTITGAIYPAIDVTAGERERGTLESLMVCPVSVIDLIVGKFLVVTTVAIMGAALNLTAVSATVFFGGFDVLLTSGGGGLPLGKMSVILMCLIPFAVLMSAIMIAVCSYARTFKEAQNYVTPVILAVLIPGGIAALPATRLDGVMLVMPVGNMVLLARDLLLGAVVPHWQTATVLLSTTLYAGAAVAVAAGVFGKESVVFADSGSLRTLFSRKLIKPSARPPISMGLLVVSLLFPVWFFIQSALSPSPDEDARGLLYASGVLMPLLFVVLPVSVLLYWRVDVRNTFSLRLPSLGHLAAGLLIGAFAWVLSHGINVVQTALVQPPESLTESLARMQDTLSAMPALTIVLVLGLVPALAEEALFRGFLLGSLRSVAGKWTTVLVTAGIFAVFHFVVFKFPVTAVLGVILAYLCWQSRSILPGVIAHLLHNTLVTLMTVRPEWAERLGLTTGGESSGPHFPPHVLAIGAGGLIVGLVLAARPAKLPPDKEGHLKVT